MTNSILPKSGIYRMCVPRKKKLQQENAIHKKVSTRTSTEYSRNTFFWFFAPLARVFCFTLPSSTVRTLAAKLREQEDSSALCITGLTHTSIRVLESALSESCYAEPPWWAGHRPCTGGWVSKVTFVLAFRQNRRRAEKCH